MGYQDGRTVQNLARAVRLPLQCSFKVSGTPSSKRSGAHRQQGACQEAAQIVFRATIQAFGRREMRQIELGRLLHRHQTR